MAPAGWTALLLAALVSSSNETSGLNAIVQQNLHQANNIRLARISDTAVVVQLPASDAYAIERPETIDVTVPAAAVRSNAEIRVSPQVATPAWRALGGLRRPPDHHHADRRQR